MSFILLGILNSQAAGAVGGGPAYDLLETQILASTASSVTFTGLDSYTDYTHLQIRMTVRSDKASNDVDFFATLNSDSGSKYSHHVVGFGGIVFSEDSNAQTRMRIGKGSADNGGANMFSGMVLDILNFSSATKNTTLRNLSAVKNDNFQDMRVVGALYDDTAAITSITFEPESDNLDVGSRFSVYGIKGA